jgi:hypothetical protein
VFALALVLQLQAAAVPKAPDSVYSTAALRDFIAKAAMGNRAPPRALKGYRANVESELALILRDSLGRELVGQIEQLAARADWKRDGRYDLHVVGFRSQSLGTPYSALTFTRMYTVPTLYGNRLVVGMNDGVLRTRRDTQAFRRRLDRDSAMGREQFRAVHPLAADRDKYYRFSGGDTVATLYVRNRPIRLVRVQVEPFRLPSSNFSAYVGELHFDADRHQLVRMRGRLVHISNERNPRFVRATGAVAVAYLEFENAEINGRYWLPHYQRSEFQAQMGLLGDTRPIYRIVSRFREYDILESGDTVVTLAEMDTLPRTRARLTFASRDSVSRFAGWQTSLGTVSGEVDSDDFDDLAPDVWKPTGRPRVDRWPRDLGEIARYNRVEGMFTGLSAAVRFRDAAPGLTARANAGIGWSSLDVRGTLSASWNRGAWIHGARLERQLASTNDFLLAFDNGLSIGPLLSGVDDHDYVDRWIGGINTTRVFKSIDRGLLTTELALVSEGAERARVTRGPISSRAFRANRPADDGDYVRSVSRLEWHPGVTGETLAPGFGAQLLYEMAAGALNWHRAEARVAARTYWRGVVFASRIDAGAVMGAELPPQVLYELGGTMSLPSYEYKEFGGDRAAIGRALAGYHFPVLRTPRRLGFIVVPGLAPGVGAGVHSGWAEASSATARDGLARLGSAPTKRVRATADYRLTFLSGALGVGMARPIDQAGRWKPFFFWGASF